MASSRIMRLMTIALLSGALSLAHHAPAGAHSFNEDGAVTFGPTDYGFSGWVSSNRRMCRVNRRVVLVKILKTGERTVYARSKSDSEANFRFDTPRATGRFYVVAPQFDRSYGDHQHRCSRIKSPKIRRK